MGHLEIRVTRLYEHGNPRRFWKGCRCLRCYQGQNDYIRMRRLAVKQGARNGIVSTARAGAHLRQLRKQGIRLKWVSEFTGIPYTAIRKTASGQKPGMREKTEKLILAVRSTPAGLVFRFPKEKRNSL